MPFWMAATVFLAQCAEVDLLAADLDLAVQDRLRPRLGLRFGFWLYGTGLGLFLTHHLGRHAVVGELAELGDVIGGVAGLTVLSETSHDLRATVDAGRLHARRRSGGVGRIARQWSVLRRLRAGCVAFRLHIGTVAFRVGAVEIAGLASFSLAIWAALLGAAIGFVSRFHQSELDCEMFGGWVSNHRCEKLLALLLADG